MKRIIVVIAMTLALLSISNRASAQWTVVDPTNLVQNIVTAAKAGSTANNMIRTVQESVKIYNQGKEYYDALKSVHHLIKDAQKVRRTIEMVSEITNIYVRSFDKMLSDPNFSVDELAAISSGYAKLLGESGHFLSELKNVVSATGLSMSDKERMDIVDRVYENVREYRNLTTYFTNKNISVSYLRAKKKSDTDRVISLYGTPSQRYW